jgi:hypothetical protein
VIDARERLRPGSREALPYADAHEKTTGQAWSSSDRDQVEIRRVCSGAIQGQVYQLGEPFEVVSRGQLGDHAAKLLVQIDLGMDDVR